MKSHHFVSGTLLVFVFMLAIFLIIAVQTMVLSERGKSNTESRMLGDTALDEDRVAARGSTDCVSIGDWVLESSNKMALQKLGFDLSTSHVSSSVSLVDTCLKKTTAGPELIQLHSVFDFDTDKDISDDMPTFVLTYKQQGNWINFPLVQIPDRRFPFCRLHKTIWQHELDGLRPDTDTPKLIFTRYVLVQCGYGDTGHMSAVTYLLDLKEEQFTPLYQCDSDILYVFPPDGTGMIAEEEMSDCKMLTKK